MLQTADEKKKEMCPKESVNLKKRKERKTAFYKRKKKFDYIIKICVGF